MAAKVRKGIIEDDFIRYLWRHSLHKYLIKTTCYGDDFILTQFYG
jgi:hypothetical protein